MSGGGKKEDSASQRWWEFYGIRYGMGTVIGAIILFYIFKTNDLLSPLLFLQKDGKLDGTQLTLLAAYGLAYCYIASAPILVLHAGRFIINDGSNKIYAIVIRIILFIILPAIMAMITYALSVNDSGTKLICALSTFILSSITFLQLIFIFNAVRHHKKLYEFYLRLSEKRESATGDITNSYKHLREHGNSFFIVLLELALGCALFTASRYKFIQPQSSSDVSVIYFVLIVLLWIFPAVFVWLVGTLFERNFSEHKN